MRVDIAQGSLATRGFAGFLVRLGLGTRGSGRSGRCGDRGRLGFAATLDKNVPLKRKKGSVVRNRYIEALEK